MKKMIAVSGEHRFASKKQIYPEDLYGEILIMVPLSDSGVNNMIGDDPEKNHLRIRIVDTPQNYDLTGFNRWTETRSRPPYG